MSFLDWLFGGLDFEYKTHGKVGEIISPAYNGTNGWFCNSRWDLVTKINKDGRIMNKSFIWDHATVRALELIKFMHGGSNE